MKSLFREKTLADLPWQFYILVTSVERVFALDGNPLKKTWDNISFNKKNKADYENSAHLLTILIQIRYHGVPAYVLEKRMPYGKPRQPELKNKRAFH